MIFNPARKIDGEQNYIRAIQLVCRCYIKDICMLDMVHSESGSLVMKD